MDYPYPEYVSAAPTITPSIDADGNRTSIVAGPRGEVVIDVTGDDDVDGPALGDALAATGIL